MDYVSTVSNCLTHLDVHHEKPDTQMPMMYVHVAPRNTDSHAQYTMWNCNRDRNFLSNLNFNLSGFQRMLKRSVNVFARKLFEFYYKIAANNENYNVVYYMTNNENFNLKEF